MEDKKTGEREKHRSEWTASGVFYGSSIARDLLSRGIFYRLRYRKSIALFIQSLDRLIPPYFYPVGWLNYGVSFLSSSSNWSISDVSISASSPNGSFPGGFPAYTVGVRVSARSCGSGRSCAASTRLASGRAPSSPHWCN